MLQMGFQKSWMSRLMPNATNCDSKDKIIRLRGQKLLSLSLYETSGLFVVCLLGLATAILTFVMEPMLYKGYKIIQRIYCFEEYVRDMKTVKRVDPNPKVKGKIRIAFF